MTTRFRATADGTLIVPLGKNEAGKEFLVTVTPVHSASKKQFDQKEYLEMLKEAAGSWVGDFPEFDDPPPEPVEPL